MKTKYPEYAQGEVQQLEKKLSPNNKRILNEFKQLCSITASPLKVSKVVRHILQLKDITELDLDKQTKESVNHFLSVLNNSNRSTHTKNEIKSYLKKFLKWKYKRVLSAIDLEEMLENIKTETFFDYSKYNEGNLVTKEDIEKMLRFAENFKEKAFLFLLFETGARPQEIYNLKWKDIDFGKEYAEVTFYSGKTRKSRTIPVNRAKEFLWEWKKNYSFDNVTEKDNVFPSRTDRNKPISSNGLNKILRRMSQKAGIKKHFWNYLFRHSTGTHFYEEMPTPIVEQIMGHKKQYHIYAHISNKKAREVLLQKMFPNQKLSTEQKNEYEERINKLENNIQEITKRFELLDKAKKLKK